MVMKLNGTNGLTFPDTTTLASAGQSSVQAWVNFDGTTTVPTIRANFNVSSVTKNGTGDYTVNFNTALVDANYSFSVMSVVGSAGFIGNQYIPSSGSITASSLQLIAGIRQDSLGNSGFVDSPAVAVAIFR